MKLTQFILFVFFTAYNMDILEDSKEFIKHPAVLGGLGYLYYKSGQKAQENKLQDLQLQDQIALNNLIANQSKNLEWQNRILNKVDNLDIELNELSAHFTSHVHVLRGTIESYANNDIPVHQRQSAIAALQDQIDRIYDVVDSKTVDNGESDGRRKLKPGDSGVVLSKRKKSKRKGELSVRR